MLKTPEKTAARGLKPKKLALKTSHLSKNQMTTSSPSHHRVSTNVRIAFRKYTTLCKIKLAYRSQESKATIQVCVTLNERLRKMVTVHEGEKVVISHTNT